MATLNKTYVYRVYSGSTYLGTLKNVSSEFSYAQTLNTAGSQLTINLGDAFPDIGAATDTGYLIDESGNHIIDETGGKIIISSVQTFANLPINLANRVIVTMVNDDYPAGKTVFDGFIDSFEADYLANSTTLLILSHGTRLDNYIIDPQTDISVNQSVYNAETQILPSDKGSVADIIAQTFSIATNIQISSVTVSMRKGGTGVSSVSLSLASGTPTSPGSILATVNLSDLPGTSVSDVDFTFGTPISLTASQTYFWEVTNTSASTGAYSTPYIEYQASNVYANGQLYLNIGGGGWTTPGYDAAFKINSSTGSAGGTFTAYDPSNIVRAVLDIFNSKGGIMTYTASSIDNTGTTAAYDFILGTILEGIKAGFSLVPSNWYWYGDVGTNLIQMHATPSVPDHKMILGRHINNIVLKQQLDGMKNIVYFSGGDVGGGVNLFRINQNSDSVSLYGQWLDRPSDNRVTDGVQADLISIGEIARYSSPVYSTTLTIPMDVYDIESFKLGQVVGFENFNNLVNSLQLQIIATQRYPDNIVLTLGSVLPRNSSVLDNLNRRLLAQETADTPSSPN